jgi:toxin ParE1/3/4
MKKRRIIKHERALRDLQRRSEYIRQYSPRAALRFLNAAQATFRLLAAQPGLGARYKPGHPVLSELRFFPITGFKNDLVFYQPSANGIQVLRVLHGAQDIHRVLAEDYGIEDNGDAGIETE